MAYENKPWTFRLFQNEKWTEGSKLPKFTGAVVLGDGTLKRLAGWVRVQQNGKEWISGTVDDYQTNAQPTGESRPTTQCAQTTGTPREPSPMPDLSDFDEIPF